MAAIIYARKADDHGPLLHVRFAAPGGGWDTRPARMLTEYPDGRMRVQLVGTPHRCVVNPASVVSQAAHEAAPLQPIDPWDYPTQPSTYADELPSCKGACHQGRNACAHPAACAGIEAPRLTTRPAPPALRIDTHRIELANGSTVADAPADLPPLTTAMRWVLRIATVSVISATMLAVWR
jgi:hypothetical protein